MSFALIFLMIRRGGLACPQYFLQKEGVLSNPHAFVHKTECLISYKKKGTCQTLTHAVHSKVHTHAGDKSCIQDMNFALIFLMKGRGATIPSINTFPTKKKGTRRTLMHESCAGDMSNLARTASYVQNAMQDVVMYHVCNNVVCNEE